MDSTQLKKNTVSNAQRKLYTGQWTPWTAEGKDKPPRIRLKEYAIEYSIDDPFNESASNVGASNDDTSIQ